MKSEQSGLQAERERCDREIAEFRRLLKAGHPDVEGLCRALIDWRTERRIIDGLKRTETETDGSTSDGGEYVETRTADQ
jgi:hypothetical protein